MGKQKRFEISFLEEILKIYSPPGKEERLSQLIANGMKELGFHHVRIDEVNNVFGEVGSGEPTILLAGHMDTIPGWRPVKITGRLIYGRGAVDAKSALAAMIMAAHKLSDSRMKGKVVVGALVDEEGNGTGIKHFVRSKPRVDYAIFGEPSGVDNITIGYKGSIDLSLSCETAPAHASAPWRTRNAVTELMRVYNAIEEYSQTMKVKGDAYHSVTTCLTQISGGTAHNVVPGKCSARVDVRVPSTISSASLLSELERLIQRYRSDEINLRVQVKDITEPFEVDKASAAVRAMVRAILQVRRKTPRLLRKTGTGDMNVLGRALKVPVTTYGPGDSHLSHTTDERISADDYLVSIEVYQAAVLNLIKFYKTKQDERT